MPQSAGAIWDRARKLLRERIPEKTVDNWLQRVTTDLSNDGSEEVTFILQVPSSFSRDYLLSNFREQIEDALREASDSAISLEVSVGGGQPHSSDGRSSASSEHEGDSYSEETPVPGEESIGGATKNLPERTDRARSSPPADPGGGAGSGSNEEAPSSTGASGRGHLPQAQGRTAGVEARPSSTSEVRKPPVRRTGSPPGPSRERSSDSDRSAPNEASPSERRDSPPSSGEKSEEEAGLFRPADLKRNLRPEFTFSEFVTGESNRLARDSSFTIANDPGDTKYNPLVLFGGVGLGKTHLAQAIAHHAIDHETVGTAFYISSERFTSEFVTAIREGTLNEFSAFYRGIDLLVVDDIQFLEGKEKTQEQFFHLFNDLHQSGKQIVLCADRSPAQISEIEDRLISRFQWGLSAEIQRPSFEMRVDLLRRKSETIGLDLEPSILEVIADSITENVRQLEGALKQLSAHAELRDDRLDISDVKQILGNSVAVGTEPRQPTVQDIIQVVAEYYSLSADDLISRGRHQTVSDARQVAMYLARQLTNQSYASIGRRFGGRDHSTVIHACNKVEDLRDVQEGFDAELDTIRPKIRKAVRA